VEAGLLLREVRIQIDDFHRITICILSLWRLKVHLRVLFRRDILLNQGIVVHLVLLLLGKH